MKMQGVMLVGLLALASGAAHAENYVTAEYDSAKLHSDNLGASFDGYAIVGKLRNDFGTSGYFGTLTVGSASQDNSDFGIKLTLDNTLYGVGAGYASHPTNDSEIYGALRYQHFDETLSAPGFGEANATSDDAILAVGGHVWFNDVMRGYGEVSYDKASHDNSGPGVLVGLEARVSQSFALFANYEYDSMKDRSSSPNDTLKTTLIGGGIKIPFGGVR